MQPSGSFTGRARRRVTRPWVRASDGIARALITLGGIGTIVAVLLVGVFLLTVALPLFKPSRSQLETAAPLPTPRLPTSLGIDESGAVAWLVSDTAGTLTMVGLADGQPIASLPGESSGLADATTMRVLPAGQHAIVGYADGSFRSGRIGLDSQFIDPTALPPEASQLALGTAVVETAAKGSADAAIVRSPSGQYARVTLACDLGAPARVADAAIIDADVTPLDGGRLVAALDADGRVRVETVTERRNLLTDEIVITSAGATIEPTAGFTPRFVRLSELGDKLFLFATDGTARRYVIRDVEAPEVMETFRTTPEETEVAAVERLFGGVALAVADATGTIRILFPSRGGHSAPDGTSAQGGAAADGLTMVTARSFAPPVNAAAESRITTLSASPRSRLFAAADAAGEVRLLHATTGATVLRLAAPCPIERLGIAPRENRVVAAGPEQFAAWDIDPGYPDVSFGTLLQPVWYENYARPTQAWETTGHESFEPKYGLVPLIFGTIKATLYAMLFATPIAILAAIYASQFLHPRWRARIKPTIELMAGLPSVVLGFVAGLVFAPFIEQAVMPVISGLFIVPLALLVGAHLWQLLPSGWRMRAAPWRLLVVGLLALPAGVLAAREAAPLVEALLFQGDFRGWLDGRGGSGFGGWVIALVPLCGVAVAAFIGRSVNPWLRSVSTGWSERQAGLASLAVFISAAAATIALACAAAVFFDAVRLDTRGGLFGTYVQRNALVVGIGMSFAIIPLIFTIADDALTSVPDHLRSASLGAGATPWQTAVRVIVPAAASGLFSAVMIGLGRAVGETMIVLMAAGNTPILDWNLFNGFQTLSAAIATELPEAARGSTHYRVLFLAALALFAITFVVNTIAELVRQRFRRRAYEL
jgi:phosphate transport system permease protein